MALGDPMSDENFVDFYGLLGVSRSASSAEIEAACLRLGASLRSDIDAGGKEAPVERFKLVEKAFDTLTNPESRAAYDRKLSTSIGGTIDTTSESMPPPHRREGILVMAACASVAAIVIAAAIVMAGPTALGLASIIGLTTFRLLPYESQSGYMPYTTYLIELDATVVLLLCFLVCVYGLLVFLAVLPRPSVLWRRLAGLWTTQ